MNGLNDLISQLRDLDFRDVGRWPLVFRLVAIGLLFVVVTWLLIWQFVFKGNLPALESAEAEQATLWSTFDTKQRKAANLEAYRQQLVEIERSFGAMLRQLPGQTEVPSLLVDISQAGLASGLEEKLFQPQPEVRRDFYAELPIKIRLAGGYHEFGKFVEAVAALPRIVTIHDVQLQGPGSGRTRGSAPSGTLTLDMVAKTYRYLDETEGSAP
ncbi:MAG: type 4a pilus biogenesis protein PilO [Steroidobacteraceae bacterium]